MTDIKSSNRRFYCPVEGCPSHTESFHMCPRGVNQELPETPCSRLQQYVDDWLLGSEVLGEDEQGCEGELVQTERDSYMRTDAVNGLIADEEFLDMAVEARMYQRATRRAEGCCEICGHVTGGHWGDGAQCERVLKSSRDETTQQAAPTANGISELSPDNKAQTATSNPLVQAAHDFLESETRVAKTSYREWSGSEWIWNDEVWERSDPEGFPLAKALREALENSPVETNGLRSLAEWHEDDGEALWWRFPIVEAPYIGSPLADDWPEEDGYYTHWTSIPIPCSPEEAECPQCRQKGGFHMAICDRFVLTPEEPTEDPEKDRLRAELSVSRHRVQTLERRLDAEKATTCEHGHNPNVCRDCHGAEEPSAFRWICPKCTTVVAIGNAACNVCQTPRPAEKATEQLRPLCICDNALTNQNPACPIHGSFENGPEATKGNDR